VLVQLRGYVDLARPHIRKLSLSRRHVSPTQAGRASAVVGGRVRGLQGSCGLWSCHRALWRCSEVREQSDRTGIAEDAKQEEMPTTKVVVELEMQARGAGGAGKGL